MLIHLENGCATDIGELDRLAVAGYSWPEYVRDGWGRWLEESEQVGRSRSRPKVFCCPSCNGRFKYLSGLVQHAESDACEEDFHYGFGSIGRLLARLWQNL